MASSSALPVSSKLTTHHVIKVVALVIMTIDHLGAFLYPDMLWLRAIGRITFPVWFFLIGHALSYRTTRELVLWALVLAAVNPFLGMAVFPLNALVTIMACQLVLRQMEKRQTLAKEPWAMLVACVIFALPSQLLMEYGSIGILYAIMGYAVRSNQMTWRSGKLVSLIALVSFLVVQQITFDFTAVQMGFVIAATSMVTLFLAKFEHRPVTISPGCAKYVPATLWLSRHSLQYYVVHRVILQALGLMQGTLSPAFHWL